MNGVDIAQVGATMAQVGNALSGNLPHPVPAPALPPRAPSKEDKALGDALCGKLRELSAQPPTVRSLMQLEQTARLAREILIAATDPYATRGRTPGGFVANGIINPGFAGAVGYDLPLPSSEYSAGPLAPSSYQENFGAAVIRELGSASGSKDEGKMSAIELVAAIALAREKNLHDVAANLEKGLAAVMGGGKLEVVLTSDEEAASPALKDTPSADPAVEIKEEAAQ